MVREITKSHDVAFSNRPQTIPPKILLYNFKDMGFLPFGEEWRQKRKLCVFELLSLKRVRSFQFIREEEAVDLVNKIREACGGKNMNKDGCSALNMTKMIMAASSNVVSRCVLGQKCEREDGNGSFGEIARKLTLQMVAFSFGDFFPSLGWMDAVTGLISKLKATFVELDTFFDEVIAQHKDKMTRVRRNDDGDNDDDDESKKKDFVDILLKLQDDEKLGFELTQVDLKGMIVVVVSI